MLRRPYTGPGLGFSRRPPWLGLHTLERPLESGVAVGGTCRSFGYPILDLGQRLARHTYPSRFRHGPSRLPSATIPLPSDLPRVIRLLGGPPPIEVLPR